MSSDQPTATFGTSDPFRVAPRPGERAGDMIGPYKLLGPLGEGGFGSVWLAERRGDIIQRVAVKIIKPGMDSRAVIARFEQERQALALMDHPNVARVFDAGATPQGRPYFVMELVSGEPITVYCDRHRLTIRQRLELFIPVCEAVQHAHIKGVIHRDIKPGNVLVTVKDGVAIPKVIDFGVAKSVSHTLTQNTVFTELGQIIGTPEYMSPEQAEHGALDIDTRTDVYSLGVLLYQLLTGSLPFEPEVLRKAGYAEIQRIIREVDPPRPSTRITSAAHADQTAKLRQTRIDDLARTLRSELEWIPLKAMRKERGRRYRSPGELADDIRNYFAGRPLLAGPESASYRARKFLRRHRLPAIVAAAFTIALVAGILGTTSGLLRAQAAARSERQARLGESAARAAAEAAAVSERAARAEESLQRRRAQAALDFLTGMLSSIDPEKARGRDITVREIVDAAAARLPQEFKDDPVAEADLGQTFGETYHALARYPEALAHLERTLALRSTALGPEHAETLTTRFNIAAVQIQQGRIEEAATTLTAVLEARRRTLGLRSKETLETASLLAFTRQLAGDDSGALAAYREVYEDQKAALGPADKATLETLTSIADVLQSLGRLDEADRAAAQLVDTAASALGPEAKTTLVALSIRADILKDLGRFEEAERFGRRAYEAKVRIYGSGHTQTLITGNILALILQALHRYDETAEILEQCVAAATGAIGAEHDATLTYRANLARCNQLRGRLEDAEKGMREVLEVRRRTAGEDALDTLIVMNNLGLLLLDLKRLQDAEPIFRQMLAGLEKAVPSDHWMLGQARVNIGECLLDQDKFQEAEQFMLAGHEHLSRVLPAGHARITKTAASLASLYQKWSRPELEAQWRARSEPK